MIVHEGGGVVDWLINKLPVEIHIPGYNYCGPGTKLDKRLKRGDAGINPLDEACKEHDIAYSKSRDLSARHRADAVLAEKAWKRVRAGDSGFGEKAAAWTVTNIMKAKRKVGAGTSSPKKKEKKLVALNSIVREAREAVKKSKAPTVKKASRVALKAARAALKQVGGRKKVRSPRVLPVPKSGGLIPLLPALFGGLTALGSLAGGASAVANAVKKAHSARDTLNEMKDHNRKMEAIALGRGLYLSRRKSGYGLYLGKKPKNF